MTGVDGAWLVWGLDDPRLGLAPVWTPGSGDVWVGEKAGNAACTHDVLRLLHGDLSEWQEGLLAGPVPESLWRHVEPCLDRVYVMFDRTVWGRQASFTERRNHAAMLVRAFHHLVASRRWRFAFFAAPPHFGCDELLKEVLVWAGVPVFYGFQSLFPGRLWVLRHDYRLLSPAVRLPGVDLPEVETEQLFYMLKVSAKTYGWHRPLLAWLQYWLGLGRFRREPLYELKRVLRQHRYQRDLAHAFPSERRLDADALRAWQQPFVYCALHLQPEMTTSALAGPGYDNHIRVIQDILRTLPAGWRLLLKENPKQDWRQRSPAFFACISSDPRVYLLDRRIPGKQVVARCDVLATVSGTAGWEALRMGKPVLLFGRAWYAGFQGVQAWADGLALDGLKAATPGSVKCDFQARIALCFAGIVDPGYLAIAPEIGSKNGVLLRELLDALPGHEAEDSF